MKINNSIKTNTYVILMFCAPSLVCAQAVPDAGSILREQQKPALELPRRPAPSIKLDEPARPAMQPSATQRFLLKAFRISGNTAFAEAELLPLVQDFTGKEVGFTQLEEAAARISRYYRERGYIVARAYLPAQQIKDGMVEIAVIEGRYGDIKHNNASLVRDSVVASHTEGLRGATVHELKLERQLLLLNDLAGVADARASLSPGAKVGETTVTFDVAAAPRFSGSVELDNYGNRFTGANRATGRLAIASPLGLGDALSAQFTKGFDGLDYARAGYQLPLGGDGLKLGGVYAHTRYRLGKSFAPLDASGASDSYTADLSYPFVRMRNFNLYGRMAYNVNQFQDRIGLSGSVTDRNAHAVQTTLSGDARDAVWGGGITVFALAFAHARLDIETPGARADDDASARTQGRSDKWNLNVLRLQSLGANAALYFSLAAQKASRNLDSSEKFVLGGANGVRAYPQGEASGDSGYLATAELRYSMNWDLLPGVVQPFAFVDAGGVTINEQPFIAGANNRRHLAGGGIGLSWARANDFQVKLTLATRIGTQPATADTDRHTRGWVQAIKYF
jgi:hemolysin activation/secretion protein